MEFVVNEAGEEKSVCEGVHRKRLEAESAECDIIFARR